MSTNRNSIREASQRPPWLDEQLYPFQSRFVEVEGNRIHYIDEGSGPTLLLLHPGVGWSCMYSEMPALLIFGEDATIEMGWLAGFFHVHICPNISSRLRYTLHYV